MSISGILIYGIYITLVFSHSKSNRSFHQGSTALYVDFLCFFFFRCVNFLCVITDVFVLLCWLSVFDYDAVVFGVVLCLNIFSEFSVMFFDISGSFRCNVYVHYVCMSIFCKIFNFVIFFGYFCYSA